MASLTALLYLWLCAAYSEALIVKTNCDDLVAIVQVFRHGQRNPVNWYPNDPWQNETYYPLGPGQLTKEGKRMHYELGTFTRGRYQSCLPAEYNPSWFRAQTTDVDRTHMSCQSNLAAVFKPTKDELWNENLQWQPIPVHPADSAVISTTPACSIFLTEMADVYAKDPLFAAMNEEFKDLYENLTEYTGSQVTTVFDVYSIYDTLHIEEQLGFELPSWTKSVYPEPMKSITGYAFKGFSQTTRMKRLAAGSWLYTAIYENFLNIFNDTSSYQKFQMWSGHDFNIATILNTIGAFEPHYPAFASTLYFELRNKSGQAVINVYHRDDDLDVFEPITINGCAFDCSLEDYATVLSDYLVDINTWTTECEAVSTSFVDLDEQMDTILLHIEEFIKSRQ